MNKRSILNSVDVGTAIFGYDASLKNSTCNVLPTYISPNINSGEIQKVLIWAIIKSPKCIVPIRGTLPA